jgi:hypothetical protein
MAAFFSVVKPAVLRSLVLITELKFVSAVSSTVLLSVNAVTSSLSKGLSFLLSKSLVKDAIVLLKFVILFKFLMKKPPET